jgi:predicted metal-dependent hydrolase
MSSNSEHTFHFGSAEIRYELSFTERKTMGIKVYPDCSVKVIVPIETKEESIEIKVREKAPWILKQQREFLSYHPLTPPRKYINGESHLYLGRQYKLKIEVAKVNEVKLKEGKLFIFHTEKTSPEKALFDWYKQKADKQFTILLEKSLKLYFRYNLENPKLEIRQMTKRWGSCTPKGKVILNLELVKAPKGCIEYVIIHELCHLIHHNHSKKFYDLQDLIMPDWSKWKERLERTLV